MVPLQENFDKFSASTPHLQKLEVPIVSTEDCNVAFRNSIKGWSHICAGAEAGKGEYLWYRAIHNEITAFFIRSVAKFC